MNIYKGTTRIVIAFPSLGIAVKIARAKPIVVVRSLMRRRNKKGSWKAAWYDVRKRERAGLDHIYRDTFKGFLSNLFEWWFTVRYGSTFLAPTYFSFGFFSIIRFVKPIEELSIEECEKRGSLFGKGLLLWKQFSRIVPRADLEGDGHHWSVLQNFGILKGRLVICDYGSSKTQAILRKHAQQLDELDLAKLL